MPLAVSVRDQANLERRLWDRREALPQVDLDMSAPGAVTVVSGAVSSLADRTGRYTVSQATSTLRPAFTQNTLNGLPVATGDGVDDRLFTTSTTGLLNNVPGHSSYFIVRALTDTPGNGRNAFVIQTNVSTAGRMRLNATTAGNAWQLNIRRLDADANEAFASSVTTGMSAYKVITATFDALSTSGNAALWENGTQRALGTRTGSAANTSATNPTHLTFGGDEPGPNGGHYVLGSAVVFHAFHPNWLRSKVEGDQAHQWGLAGSLALGHPCQSRPPLRGPG